MNLYLVQHGEARSKEEDPQRPLSDTGRADAEKVALFAAQHANVSVMSIMHSGKTRAEQTASVFAEHLKPSAGVSATEGLEPNASPSIWAARLADARDDIMLVGHLPHMARLCACLLTGDSKPVVRFVNSGIVCLERNEAGDWSLLWAVTPEII